MLSVCMVLYVLSVLYLYMLHQESRGSRQEAGGRRQEPDTFMYVPVRSTVLPEYDVLSTQKRSMFITGGMTHAWNCSAEGRGKGQGKGNFTMGGSYLGGPCPSGTGDGKCISRGGVRITYGVQTYSTE